MSYRYDNNTRRYVFSNQQNAESPVSLQHVLAEGTRQPAVFRSGSNSDLQAVRSLMTSPNAKEGSQEKTLERTASLRNGIGVIRTTGSQGLTSIDQERQAYGLTDVKDQMKGKLVYDGQNSRQSAGGIIKNTGLSTPTISNQQTDKNVSDLETSVQAQLKRQKAAQSLRQPASNKRTDYSPNPAGNPSFEQKRNMELQQENISMKTEVINMRNELNSFKTRMASSESSHKQELEQQIAKAHQLQSTINAFETMKQQIALAIGFPHVSIQELTFRVQKMATDFKKASETIKQKDDQIKQMSSRIQLIESQQHNAMSKNYEQSLKKLREAGQADKNRIVDLSRQLEYQKALVQKANDQMNNLYQYQQISENDNKRIFELTQMLEEHKIMLRIAKDEVANANVAQKRMAHQNDRQRLIDLTQMLQEQKLALKRAREELATIPEVRDAANKSQTRCEELTRALEDLRRQFNRQGQTLTGKENAFRKMEETMLHEKQQKEAFMKTLKEKQAELNNVNNQLKSANNQIQKMQWDLKGLEHKDKLEKQVSEMRQKLNQTSNELNRSNFNLQKLERQQMSYRQNIDRANNWKQDFHRISEMYAQKQKECLKILDMLEQTKAVLAERDRLLDNFSAELKRRMAQQQSRHNQQMNIVRHELEETRANWHNRLLNECNKFQGCLKEQVEEIRLLKKKLSDKQQLVSIANSKISDAQASADVNKAELDIDKLRHMTQRKGMQLAFDVQLQELQAEMAKATRKLEASEQKCSRLAEQLRNKDIFIQKQLLSRNVTSQEKRSIETFFEEFTTAVDTESVKKKREQEQKRQEQLEQANRALAAELARIKGIRG